VIVLLNDNPDHSLTPGFVVGVDIDQLAQHGPKDHDAVWGQVWSALRPLAVK
jgi:hypothetical protein